MWQGKVRVIFPLGSSGPKQFDEREGKKEKKKRKRKKKEKKGEEERSEKLQLLSRFHSDRAVDSGRSKRQSWSTQRELRVGTKISGFAKLREVEVLSYSV